MSVHDINLEKKGISLARKYKEFLQLHGCDFDYEIIKLLVTDFTEEMSKEPPLVRSDDLERWAKIAMGDKEPTISL